jgi:CBS domain-containing protein
MTQEGPTPASLSGLFSHSVQELIKTEPLMMPPSATLQETVESMRANDRGCVLVVNGRGKLFGVFTERDVVIKLNGDDHTWRGWLLGDCMTPAPKTISRETTIGQALQKMNEGHFRHIPVVDTAGCAVGVVTIHDIIIYLVEHHPAAFLNLPSAR